MTEPSGRSADLLTNLEHYYDEVPRAWATTEEIGPFTLFLRTDPSSWPYYARPTLSGAHAAGGAITAAAVGRVRDRQRELGAPEALEWVDEVTPALTQAAREAGLVVHEHPLMVLERAVAAPTDPDVTVRLVQPDDPDLAAIHAAIDAAFNPASNPAGDAAVNPAGDAAVNPAGDAAVNAAAAGTQVEALRERLRSGGFRMIGARDASGPVGGGSHSPRGAVTELTGIGVLPRARRRGTGAAITAALVDDARSLGVGTVFLSAEDQQVADVYARVGFTRVGTACIAEPPS